MSSERLDAQRTREAPGSARPWARLVGGWSLVALGLVAAAGAARAYRFDRALPELVPDAPPALGADVGDDRPFEPFSVAVIGPVRGDHAALERAIGHAHERGAQLVVARGDLFSAPSVGLAALADVLLRTPGVVLLAAPGDRAPIAADERLGAVVTAPESWQIHTRDCVVVGGTAGVTVSGPDGAHVWTMPLRPASEGCVRLDVLHVITPGSASRETLSIERGMSLRGVARDLSLGALWPLAGSGPGLAGLLLGAFLSACAGLRVTRSGRSLQ